MRERYSLLKIALVGVALYEIGNLAFDFDSKKKIWERDHGQSVWSGETEHLQAAHLNHDKSSPDYNNPENGRLLTQKEQYIDHFNRHGTVNIGLTEAQNKSALGIIYHHLTPDERAGLPPPSEAGKTIIPIPRRK